MTYQIAGTKAKALAATGIISRMMMCEINLFINVNSYIEIKFMLCHEIYNKNPQKNLITYMTRWKNQTNFQNLLFLYNGYRFRDALPTHPLTKRDICMWKRGVLQTKAFENGTNKNVNMYYKFAETWPIVIRNNDM